MSEAASSAESVSGGDTNESSIGFTGSEMMWAVIAVAGAAVLVFIFFLSGRKK